MGQVGYSSGSPLQNSSWPCLGLTVLRLGPGESGCAGRGCQDLAQGMRPWLSTPGKAARLAGETEVNDTPGPEVPWGVLLEAKEGTGSAA